MKKLVTALASAALVLPSVASAATAPQALSLKSAAISPVRAAAVSKGAKNRLSPVAIGVVVIALAGGVAVIASGGGNNGDSN